MSHHPLVSASCACDARPVDIMVLIIATPETAQGKFEQNPIRLSYLRRERIVL
ncbi:MAG TPA: hypothetical protein VKB46_28215 [Pyrinomonadaceae bacterium]|nr:hypothetical protein [Pyrinomonadaceae bacterium]